MNLPSVRKATAKSESDKAEAEVKKAHSQTPQPAQNEETKKVERLDQKVGANAKLTKAASEIADERYKKVSAQSTGCSYLDKPEYIVALLDRINEDLRELPEKPQYLVVLERS